MLPGGKLGCGSSIVWHFALHLMSLALELVSALAVNSLDLVLIKHLAVNARVGELDLDCLACSDGSNTCWGAREDEVTLLELHNTRDKGDELGDVKDHVVGDAGLLDAAVDSEGEADLCDVGNLGLGDEGPSVSCRPCSYPPYGAKGIKALGSRPWQSLFLDCVLHVTSSHIDSEGWDQ